MSNQPQIVSALSIRQALKYWQAERQRISEEIIPGLERALAGIEQTTASQRKPPTKAPAKPSPKQKPKKDTSPKGYVEACVPYLLKQGEAKVADMLSYLHTQKGYVATTRPSLESSLLNESRKPTPRIVKLDAGKYGLPQPSAVVPDAPKAPAVSAN